MKRILSVILLVLGFWSASSSLAAEDEGRQLVIRMYIAGGQTIDLDASEVDSITATTEVQQIWNSGTCDVIPLVSIDSICYMYPSLKVSEREVNFGKVQVGSGKTYSLCLTNTSAYPETYTVNTAGVFTVANAGQEIVIGPEEAVDVEVCFDPASATSYGGSLVVTSASIAGGKLYVPLKGIGVETAEEEEPYIIPPTETEFLVEVPEDMDVEQLAGFKIVNSYGEFPLVVSAKSRKMARTKSGKWGISVTCKYSLNGLQCNFLMDFNNNPYGFTISFPGEQPVMSAEETAIALLMADPLMITDSKTEYHNTVKVIKHLDNYGEYLEKVKDLYDKGTKQMMCPDYSQIDASRVIFELLAKTRDNSELELDGMSLVDVQRLNNSIKYKIRNTRKRILHAYSSRVIMNEGNVAIETQQEDTHTMTEFMEEMMENADIIGEYFDDEDKATIVDLKEMDFIRMNCPMAVLTEEPKKSDESELPSAAFFPSVTLRVSS